LIGKFRQATPDYSFIEKQQADIMKIALISMPVKDPVKAHEIYTSKLGFISKEFDAGSNLAIVVSAEDPEGTAMLLEPCQGTFAESYQKSAVEANLPIMVFGVRNVEAELERLKTAGVAVRPDLDKPDWGLVNMFEDGCGNILMIKEISG
jgi:predicted enzyme related to lactoylglutathione lyase